MWKVPNNSANVMFEIIISNTKSYAVPLGSCSGLGRKTLRLYHFLIKIITCTQEMKECVRLLHSLSWPNPVGQPRK